MESGKTTMKLSLLGVSILCFCLPALAAPNNAQLNEKIKTLKERVQLLEDVVDELRQEDIDYVFSGFTVENIAADVADAFVTCRDEFGPTASIATTEEVLEALRNGTYSARGDGYVFSTDAQYNMGVARDKHLLEILHGAFIVVGIGGKTSPVKVDEAPVACSKPR
jgi:hypothetical protein